jgi:hypothetical protein
VSSRYVVFQYAPNPLNGECINFGVACYAIDEHGHPVGMVGCRFITDWRRVQSFARGADVSFLARFAEGFDMTGEQIEAAAGRWVNSLQVSSPRGSLRRPAELLAEIAPRMLPDLKITPGRYIQQTNGDPWLGI